MASSKERFADFLMNNKTMIGDSVLAGYEELPRPRFVLSQTSALIIPHILLDLIQ